jgi:polynucleotide 5'-kinase involved in rRNA processing
MPFTPHILARENPTRKSMLYITCSLRLQSLQKKNAKNIEIQLYAVDCSGWKHGITKRKV